MRRTLITLLWFLVGSCASLAQEPDKDQWAKDMFDHTSHNFGVVARGQKAEHRFSLENPYLEDVTVSADRFGCQCIKPKVDKPTLKTYEKGEIVVTVDTRKFLGRKDGTIKVTLTALAADGPISKAEVRLNCYVYIRSDVVLQPGAVRFDSVSHGTGAPAQKIAVSYAGRDDWEILRAECDNPHLDLKVVETGRQSGQVSYDLTVGLKSDAPVGYLRDHVVLVTNDRNANATRLLVPVEGLVTPTVSAQPSALMLGLLNPGQQVGRTLVVRGDKPFRITAISGPDDRLQFQWKEDVARSLHVIPVTFTAAEEPGKITGTIRIQTDVAGSEVVEVRFDGQVLSPASQASPGKSSPTGASQMSAREDEPSTEAVVK
jgi:hypothetical protein